MADAPAELLHESVDDTDLTEGQADVVDGGEGASGAGVASRGAHDGSDPLEAGDADSVDQIRRAGAQNVLTYYAVHAARLLQEQSR